MLANTNIDIDAYWPVLIHTIHAQTEIREVDHLVQRHDDTKTLIVVACDQW